MAILSDLGDLSGRARPQHHRSVAGPERAELDQIGRLLVLVGDSVLLADHGDQTGERRGGNGGDGFAHFIHGTGVLPWRGGPGKPVVDGFAETLVGHAHHGDGGDIRLVEGAEVGKQVGRGFDEIAARRQVEHEHGLLDTGRHSGAEGERASPGLTRSTCRRSCARGA